MWIEDSPHARSQGKLTDLRSQPARDPACTGYGVVDTVAAKRDALILRWALCTTAHKGFQI